MVSPLTDPRTEDTLVYDVLRGPQGAPGEVIGRATFRDGVSTVAVEGDAKIAIEEVLGRSFVDRAEADERPRGYRRTRRGRVEMLVAGTAEHFVARMRGLWLSYPDGTVVTARVAADATVPAILTPESTDVGPPITDSSLRIATLANANTVLDVRPLAIWHPPETGMRPAEATADRDRASNRTDCGWLV